MALHVVRSLGQAFDVCHKLNPRPKKKKAVSSTDETSTKTEEKNEEKSEDIKLDDVKEPTPKEEGEQQSFNTALDSINGDPFLPGGGETVGATGTSTDSSIPPLIDLDPLAPLNLPTLPPSTCSVYVHAFTCT